MNWVIEPVLDGSEADPFGPGMLGRLHSQEAEREVADYLIGLLEAKGTKLATDFGDPDWIVACETLGAEAGVALLDRETRRRYGFVQVH